MTDDRWRLEFEKHFDVQILDADQKSVLQQISDNFLSDFTGGTSGHFDLRDTEKLLQKSAEIFLSELNNQSSPDAASMRNIWHRVVVHYHQNSHWGVETQIHGPAPKPSKTQSQLLQRELFSYIWVLVQAGIIMKGVVYYFGLKATDEKTTESQVYLTLVLIFSAGSLFYFAWRKFKTEDT